MSYQTPNTTNTPVVAATAALGVVLAVSLVALPAMFFGGETSDAASTTPVSPVSQTVAVETSPLEAAVPAEQQVPAASAETSPAAATVNQTETETQADPAAPTQPVSPTQPAAPAQPAAPVPAAPTQPATEQQAAPVQAAPSPAAPVPFHATCGTSKSTVTVGETFIISGTHLPPTVSVSWAFEHGDGYVDHNNPSHAYYEHASTYTVTGIAKASGMGEQRIYCGTVTVTDPAPHIEYACTIDANHIPVNGHTVFRAHSTREDLHTVYTFDHGDGYTEVANPSYATYYQPGTYHVSVTAFSNGVTTHVGCGSVTVYAEAPVECPTHSVVGLSEAHAHAAISAAHCTPFTAVRGLEIFPITSDYRTDRVQLVVGPTGTVMAATIG